MATKQPGWEFYRSFLAVAHEGSLSGAARRLALTQPTIGRHVDALEQALGTALFTRSQHGMTPTAVAVGLIPYAEAMAASAEALIREASGEATEERGTIRLAASEIMGAEVLPAILAAFQARRPHVTLELALSNRAENLVRRDADIAIRMFRPAQHAIVARRLGSVPIGLYAHRRYVDRRGMPRSMAELTQHTLIGFDRDSSSVRQLRSNGLSLTREMFGYRCDNDLAQLAALRAGAGIGGCQVGVARRDPDLLPVLPDILRFELDMWLAMHEDLRASRRVRLLYDHLATALLRYVATTGDVTKGRSRQATAERPRDAKVRADRSEAAADRPSIAERGAKRSGATPAPTDRRRSR